MHEQRADFIVSATSFILNVPILIVCHIQHKSARGVVFCSHLRNLGKYVFNAHMEWSCVPDKIS